MHERVGELVRVDSRKRMMMNQRIIRRSSSVKIFGKEDRFETVDFSGMNLKSIPATPSFNLGMVSKLNLSNNNLQMIPESLIARLLNLVVLDVHSNQLKTLPNSIGCLSKLKVLNVAGNNLELLPKTIENCSRLEELDANFNQLNCLPDTIGFELVNLKKLIVGSNKLVSLPSSTGHLTSLTHLDARLNCLHSLPENLETLTNLQTLNVSQNFHHLKTLPYSIGLLFSLTDLEISYNSISALPDSMGCLGKLRKLSVEGNPLVSPTMEVVNQGLAAVRAYLSEKMNNGGNQAPKKKKIGVIRKLKVKCGSFNGGYCFSFRQVNNDDGVFKKSKSFGSSGSYSGVFSPWRIFSPQPPRHSV